MTLEQIATQMGTTRDDLRERAERLEGGWAAVSKDDQLRAFIRTAFAAGHSSEDIQPYIDRSEIMVLHALRMVCVDEHGCQYGQSLPEIARVLRREAA